MSRATKPREKVLLERIFDKELSHATESPKKPEDTDWKDNEKATLMSLFPNNKCKFSGILKKKATRNKLRSMHTFPRSIF